jgi:hypothetical protein
MIGPPFAIRGASMRSAHAASRVYGAERPEKSSRQTERSQIIFHALLPLFNFGPGISQQIHAIPRFIFALFIQTCGPSETIWFARLVELRFLR